MCEASLHPSLTSWPCDDRHTTVGHVIPEWPVWPQVEEEALRFSPEETAKFDDPDFGRDLRRLQLTSVAPTLLHSYAHTCSPCPCGCRGPFSDSRLRNGGMRGFGIRSAAFPYDRFLHCQEAAFLLTIPATCVFQEGRSDLVLLGQVAAPLQSLWAFHALLTALFAPFDVQPFRSAVNCLEAYKSELFDLRHDRWTWSDSVGVRHVAMFDVDSQSDYSFVRAGRVTVERFLAAETFRQEWARTMQVMDGFRILPHDAILQTRGRYGPYTLSQRSKHRPATLGWGCVVILIEVDQVVHYAYLVAGAFVFEAVLQCGLSLDLRLCDCSQHPVSLTARLWADCRLGVLGTAPPTPCVGFGVTHSGQGSFYGGLSRSLLHRAALFLLREHCSRGSVPQAYLYGVGEGTGDFTALFGPPRESWCLLPGRHFFFVLSSGHWTLLELTDDYGYPRALLYDGFPRHSLPLAAAFLVDFFESKFGLTFTVEFREFLAQSCRDSCGTIALGHLALCLRLLPWADSKLVESIHPALAILSALDSATEDIGFGPANTEDPVHELAVILKQHGVPDALALDRATQGVRKLGNSAISIALKSNKPWPALKELGSRPGHTFQWVLADELQAQIRARAESKFKVQPSQKRHLAPRQQLQLLPDTFAVGSVAVAQIPFAAVKKGAAGLAFASLSDIAPFLKQDETISDAALAILTTKPIPKVARIAGKSCFVEAVPTQTLRICLFRDSWPLDWSEFMRQPFRAILQQVPGLQLCRSSGCGDGCIRYHAPVDEPIENLD